MLTQPDCAGEEYLPAPMNFAAPIVAHTSTIFTAEDGTVTVPLDPAEPELQFSLNSVSYPQFNPKLSQWYTMTKDAFEVNTTQSKSYQEWLQTGA